MSKTQRLEETFLPDPRFGRLADRFFPPDQQPPVDESWTDPRFASGPSEVSHPLRNQIVDFANTDDDAKRLLAAAGVRDQAAKSAFRTRTRKGKWSGTCQWEPSSNSWLFVVQREDGERRNFHIEGSPDDADAAKIAAAGELAETDNVAGIRVLGPDHVILLQRIASQNPPHAFETGLALMFAEFAEQEGFDPYSHIAKEEFQPALQELTWIIFLGTSVGDKLGEADAIKFRQFATDFIGVRPWNLTILGSALDAFRSERVMENLQKLDQQSQQPEQAVPNLDELSDAEIDQLYDSASALYIKALKHNRR